MDTKFFLTFIDILVPLLEILILIRVLLSWFRPYPQTTPERILHEVTEPILWPFQKILPPMMGIDFSPILAFVVLEALRNLAHSLL